MQESACPPKGRQGKWKGVDIPSIFALGFYAAFVDFEPP
jgi:hypothetical protein